MFSIIVPTFNRGQLLLKTLNSLCSLNHHSFEIIVVDDGSTDETELIVNSMSDSRISYHKITNGERGAARNFGAIIAKGVYLNFFDSDDLAYPNHLTLAETTIKNEENPAVFALSYDIIDEQGCKLKKVELSQTVQSFITEGNHLSCNGVFIKKETALKFPFIEDRGLSGSEDYELWLRLSARYTFRCSPSISHAVVQHDGRSTVNFKAEPLILRKQKMIEYAFQDEYVKSKFGHARRKILAGTFSYVALHLALTDGNKKLALAYWKKSFSTYIPDLFSRRSLSIIKHLISN